MVEEKIYLSPTIGILLMDNIDVVRTSGPVNGEDGNDIFDDR